MSSKWGIRYESRDREQLDAWSQYDFGDTGTVSHLKGYLADVEPAIGWHLSYQQGGIPQAFAMPTDTFTFTAQYIAGGPSSWRQFEAAAARDAADQVPGRITIYREGVAAATNECYIVAAARSDYQWKANTMTVEYTVQPLARPWFTRTNVGLGASFDLGGDMDGDLFIYVDNADGDDAISDPHVTVTNSTTGWSNTYGLTGYTLPAGYILSIDTRMHEVLVRDFHNSNEWESVYQYRTPGIKGSGSYIFEQVPSNDGYTVTRSSAYGMYLNAYSNYARSLA